MMSSRELVDEQLAYAENPKGGPTPETFELDRLLKGRSVAQHPAPLPQVVVGELLAIAGDGKSPLVIYPGQPGTAALRARSVLDLHGAHIGQSVVLSFEGGDPSLPIVMGVIRQVDSQALVAPGHVEIDADGERMVVSAKAQLVLKCGKASITLTRAGKVLIEGSYLSSRSTGVNRIKGGSVQLN
jgi:Domain of unknown function (DUF6484)